MEMAQAFRAEVHRTFLWRPAPTRWAAAFAGHASLAYALGAAGPPGHYLFAAFVVVPFLLIPVGATSLAWDRETGLRPLLALTRGGPSGYFGAELLRAVGVGVAWALAGLPVVLAVAHASGPGTLDDAAATAPAAAMAVLVAGLLAACLAVLLERMDTRQATLASAAVGLALVAAAAASFFAAGLLPGLDPAAQGRLFLASPFHALAAPPYIAGPSPLGGLPGKYVVTTLQATALSAVAVFGWFKVARYAGAAPRGSTGVLLLLVLAALAAPPWLVPVQAAEGPIEDGFRSHTLGALSLNLEITGDGDFAVGQPPEGRVVIQVGNRGEDPVDLGPYVVRLASESFVLGADSLSLEGRSLGPRATLKENVPILEIARSPRIQGDDQASVEAVLEGPEGLAHSGAVARVNGRDPAAPGLAALGGALVVAALSRRGRTGHAA